MQSVTVRCGQPDPFFIRQNLADLFRIGVVANLQPTPAVVASNHILHPQLNVTWQMSALKFYRDCALRGNLC